MKKSNYADLNKWRETWKLQKRRYYGKTQFYSQISNKRVWTSKEDDLVIQHQVLDIQLAEQIHRSVAAIQIRRCKLKKKYNEKKGN